MKSSEIQIVTSKLCFHNHENEYLRAKLLKWSCR